MPPPYDTDEVEDQSPADGTTPPAEVRIPKGLTPLSSQEVQGLNLKIPKGLTLVSPKEAQIQVPKGLTLTDKPTEHLSPGEKQFQKVTRWAFQPLAPEPSEETKLKIAATLTGSTPEKVAKEHPVALGVTEGITDFGRGLTSPFSIATLAGGPLVGTTGELVGLSPTGIQVVSRTLSALFAAQAAYGTYKDAGAAYDAYKQGNNRAAARAATGAVFNLGAAAFAGTHAARGGYEFSKQRLKEKLPGFEEEPPEVPARTTPFEPPEAPGGPAAPTGPAPAPAPPTRGARRTQGVTLEDLGLFPHTEPVPETPEFDPQWAWKAAVKAEMEAGKLPRSDPRLPAAQQAAAQAWELFEDIVAGRKENTPPGATAPPEAAVSKPTGTRVLETPTGPAGTLPETGKATVTQELEPPGEQPPSTPLLDQIVDRVTRHAETEAQLRRDLAETNIPPEDYPAVIKAIQQQGEDAYAKGDIKAALEAAHHQILMERIAQEGVAAPPVPESADVPRGTTAPPAEVPAPPATPPLIPPVATPAQPPAAAAPAPPVAAPAPGYVAGVAKKIGKGKPAVSVPVTPTGRKETVSAKIAEFTKRAAMEAQGQEILDDMIENKENPSEIEKQFWRETYFKLPGNVQKRFQSMLKSLSGSQPGDVLGTDKDGNPIIAKTWMDIADHPVAGTHLGDDAEYLEGGDRGYAVLMREANRALAGVPTKAQGGAKRAPDPNLIQRKFRPEDYTPQEGIGKYSVSEVRAFLEQAVEHMRNDPTTKPDDLAQIERWLMLPDYEMLNSVRREGVSEKDITEGLEEMAKAKAAPKPAAPPEAAPEGKRVGKYSLDDVRKIFKDISQYPKYTGKDWAAEYAQFATLPDDELLNKMKEFGIQEANLDSIAAEIARYTPPPAPAPTAAPTGIGKYSAADVRAIIEAQAKQPGASTAIYADWLKLPDSELVETLKENGTGESLLDYIVREYGQQWGLKLSPQVTGAVAPPAPDVPPAPVPTAAPVALPAPHSPELEAALSAAGLNDPATSRRVSRAIQTQAIHSSDQLNQILQIAKTIQRMTPGTTNIAAVLEALQYGGMPGLEKVAGESDSEKLNSLEAIVRANEVLKAIREGVPAPAAKKPRGKKAPLQRWAVFDPSEGIPIQQFDTEAEAKKFIADEHRPYLQYLPYKPDKQKWDVFDPKDGKPIATYDSEELAKGHVKNSPNNLDYAPADQGYKGGSIDVAFARVAGGKVKLGADPEALGRVLGSSLYGKDKAEVITKELLQNAMDAIRSTKGLKEVTVEFNTYDHTITITDTGNGMTRHELETVFTDLGASGKRSDVTASGGFGLAKAAPLMMSHKLTVTTVSKEKGKLYRHTFEATPAELLNEGVEIKTEELPRDAGIETGTVIESELDPDVDFYQAKSFATKSRNSIRLPGKLIIKGGSSYRDDDELPKMKRAASDSVPGADIDVYVDPSGTKELGSFPYIEVDVNNNGIYQFTHGMYPPKEAAGVAVPKRMAIDIRASVPEGDDDYPFTANRESLRGPAGRGISKLITEKIIRDGINAHNKKVATALENLPAIKIGATEIPVFDSGKRMTDAEVKTLLSDPAVIDLAHTINRLTQEAIAVLSAAELPFHLEGLGKKIKRIGLVLSDKVHGVHITDPVDKTKTQLFVNPFAGIKGDAGIAASLIWHTIKHEIIHDAVSGHTEEFTKAEAVISAALGGKHEISAIQELEDVYGDPSQPGGIRPDLSRALQLYAESRERNEVAPDIFGGEDLSRVLPEGDTGRVRTGADPTLSTTSRELEEDPNILLDVETGANIAAPVWYLKSERVIGDKMKGPMPGPDVLRMLQNNGVSPDELKWTGLDDYLPGAGRVTPEDVRNHIAENGIKIDEVRKGAGVGAKTRDEWAQEEYDQPYNDLDVRGQHWVDAMMEPGSVGKYAYHTLPGGENYRELLLTLPKLHSTTTYRVTLSGQPIREEFNSQAEADKKIAEISAQFPDMAHLLDSHQAVDRRQIFVQTHWDEPNVVVHVRANDRTPLTYTPEDIARIQAKIEEAMPGVKPSSFASGSPYVAVRKGLITPVEAAQYSHAKGYHNDTTGAVRKLLHVEEIQSDWHQKGRKYRYADPKKPFAITGVVGQFATREEAEAEAIANKVPLSFIRDERTDELPAGVIPDAPFKKTWQEVALRRMIRYAAENGYDGVSWTGGHEQAERYDLSKHISRLEWNPGTKYLIAYDPTGGKVIDQEVEQRDLPNYIGKEATDKLAPKIDEWQHDTRTDLTPKFDEKAQQWVILDGNGDPLIDREGDEVRFSSWAEDDAYEYVKFQAENNRDQAPTPQLSGLDLKLGGEGMRGFYDKIVPNYLNKFGKKFGAAVAKTQIKVGSEHDPGRAEPTRFTIIVTGPGGAEEAFVGTADTQEEAERELQRFRGIWPTWEMEIRDNQSMIEASKQEDYQTVQYLPITPAMRDSVLKEGVPLFNLERGGGPRRPMPMPPGGAQRQRSNVVLREALPGVKEYREKRHKNWVETKRMQEELIAVDKDELVLRGTQAELGRNPSFATIHKLNQDMTSLNQRRKGIDSYRRRLRDEAEALEMALDPSVGEVRLDKEGNPTVYLNKTAMQMIRNVIRPGQADMLLKGQAMSVGEARWLKNKIITGGTANGDEQAVYPAFMRLLDAAIAKSRNAGITVVGRTWQGVHDAIETLREELIHRWQRMRSEDGRHDTHLTDEVFLHLRHALPLPALDYLSERNYTGRNELENAQIKVIEAAAKIMAGKWRKMGLTKQQAVDWLSRYYEEVAGRHGVQAVLEVEHTYGVAREFQKELEKIYGPGEQGTGTEETTQPTDPNAGRPLSSVERGREGEAGGDAAGRAGRGGRVDTPEFKRWFGESKVVDENGEPLKLYHGTTRKNPKVLGESFEAGVGVFLTDNEDVASTFTFPREYGESVFYDEDGEEIEPGDVVPVYARIENPLVIDDEDEEYEGPWAQDVADDTALQTRTLKQAKADGHDGVILRNVKEGIGERQRGNTYIVFDPKQVKHAERNKGTYDPESANILSHIEPAQAMETNVPVEMPTHPEFEQAVRNTPGAKITPDGLLINVVRRQKPEQEGEQAIRTGVFYLPEKSRYSSNYGTGKIGYGGTQKLEGETLLRRPLFVKGAVGGKAPEAAYEAIKGKGSIKKLHDEIRDVVRTGNAFFTPKVDRAEFRKNVANFLREHDADPHMAFEIVRNSTQGNQLNYALQENVIAHTVRDAGYDSVLGFSRGKKGPFISELFDVREQTYPSNVLSAQIHDKFLADVEKMPQSEPLYHVTLTKNAKKIKSQGLQRFKPSNWVQATSKERYGQGEVYAFDNLQDAVRWAGKMDWEFNKTLGSGKVSIVKFAPGEHEWEVDTADPLSQGGKKGRWLKSERAVPASQILGSAPVTQDAIRALVQNTEPELDFGEDEDGSGILPDMEKQPTEREQWAERMKPVEKRVDLQDVVSWLMDTWQWRTDEVNAGRGNVYDGDPDSRVSWSVTTAKFPWLTVQDRIDMEPLMHAEMKSRSKANPDVAKWYRETMKKKREFERRRR